MSAQRYAEAERRCARRSAQPEVGEGQLPARPAAGADGPEGGGGQAARAWRSRFARKTRRRRACSFGCWSPTDERRRRSAATAVLLLVLALGRRRRRPGSAGQRQEAPRRPSASSRRPSSATPRDPERPRRARPGLLGPQRVSRARSSVPARGEGRTDVGGGAQLARRRALGEGGSSRRHRRVQEGDRARPELRARLHESGLRAGHERRLAEAVAVFQKALALEPNSLAAHLNLGMALREKGDLDGRAASTCGASPPAIPTNASIQYELGQTLRQSGDLTGAVAAFEKALEIEPELREAYYALGVGAEAAERARRAEPPAPAAASPADDLYDARAGRRRARRSDRRPRAAHRGASPRRRAMRTRTTCSASFSASRATCRRRSPTSSARSRSGLNPPRPTTTSASRSGTAAPRTGPSPSCARACGSIPRPAPATRFSEPPCARRAIWPARARQPAARDRAAAADRRRLRRSRHHLSSRRRARQGARTVRGRAEPPRRPRRPTPDWDVAPIAGARATALAARAPGLAAEAHNVLGRCSAARAPTAARWRPSSARPIRLRPDFAEAHNNLGLVLIQAGDDAGGHRVAARGGAPRAGLRRRARQSRRRADADRRRGRRFASWRQAVALAPASVKAQFNLAVAYGASPALGAAKEIEQLRKVIALRPTFARAHLALGKALLRDGKVRRRDRRSCRRRRGWSRRAGKRTTSSVSRWRAPAARRRRRPSSQKGRELVAADDRNQNASLDIAEGRAALEQGRRWSEAAAKFRHALQLRPDSSDAQRYCSDDQVPAEAAANRRLRVPRGSMPPRRRSGGRELEGYIREGRFKEVEPLLAEYVKERPRSSWGWYALGYSLFAQQKIGESIKALAKSLELDVTQRRGPQDPRPQPDDHRPLRRRAGRVRAGDPLQAGLRGDATTTSASCSRSRTTGSRRGRRSKRRSGSIRRTSRRSTRSASRSKRSATMRARSRATRRRSR